ncbi:hypothetical protein OJ998_22305 [Solirubrobacter taibaiensis]|nr:hypothetical protein [Solirubrobacter taibaiensis]
MSEVDPRTRPSEGDARPWIEAWAAAPELAELVVAFGGERVEGRDLQAWLEYLEGFSARWDYRKGKERNLVADQEFSPELEEQVLAAADALGLRGVTAPAHREYELVVILGGLVRACLARPRHAADLLADGRVTAHSVVGLGGLRELGGNEHELVAELVDEPVDNEFGAMDAGIRAAFGPLAAAEPEPADLLDGAVAATSYRTAGGLPVHVVAAPPLEGRARANTPDTFAWLASRRGLVLPGDRLLLVTTSIYVPYQHAGALRMLAVPHGIKVDTIGVEPGFVDPRLEQPFKPHSYLQEIRSTILGLRQLLLDA